MSSTIVQLQQLLQKPRLLKGEVAHLFSLIRVLLEEGKLKHAYPTLNTYCDWSVHSNLNRSEECLTILESLTNLFVKATTVGFVQNEIHLEVNQILGINRLRAELIQILESSGLASMCAKNEDNWKGIFALLVQTLIERPLEWPNKPNARQREIMSRAENSASGSDFFIRKFSFADIDNQLHWKIEANVIGVDIIGPVLWK